MCAPGVQGQRVLPLRLSRAAGKLLGERRHRVCRRAARPARGFESRLRNGNFYIIPPPRTRTRAPTQMRARWMDGFGAGHWKLDKRSRAWQFSLEQAQKFISLESENEQTHSIPLVLDDVFLELLRPVTGRLLVGNERLEEDT